MARRSPERAKAVLDRAARMEAFKPSLLDRRIGDKQMRTPGYDKNVGVRMFEVDRSKMKPLGVQDVPLKDVRTQQATVSVAKVAAKLNGNSGQIPEYIKHNGKYYTNDGNHATTAARALGMKSTKANVFEIPSGAMRSQVPPSVPGKPLSGLTKAGLAASAIAPVVAGANAYNARLAAGGNKTEAMGDAIQQGTVAGAGALTATAVMAGMAKAVQMVAPKVAPALGPVGLAIGAGMTAYGAYQGYKNTGTVSGALKGAVGLETAQAADASVGVDAATMAIAKQTSPTQNMGLSREGTTKDITSGTQRSSGGATRFEGANASFEKSQVAKQEQPAADGEGEKQRGWGWKARTASAKSRGIQEWNHPEE
jgi:hypothetical protein